MPKRPDVTQVEVPNPGLTLPPNKVQQAAMQARKIILLVVTNWAKTDELTLKFSGAKKRQWVRHGPHGGDQHLEGEDHQLGEADLRQE